MKGNNQEGSFRQVGTPVVVHGMPETLVLLTVGPFAAFFGLISHFKS
jgi:hypothetical protein